MSFDVNGDRSPILHDKPPQISEISSRSASQLGQLNGANDGSRVQSSQNKQLTGVQGGSCDQSSHNKELNGVHGGTQIRAASSSHQKSSQQGRLNNGGRGQISSSSANQLVRVEIGASSNSLLSSNSCGNFDRAHPLSEFFPLNSLGQLDLGGINQNLNAKEKLGIASQILGSSSQNLGVPTAQNVQGSLSGGHVQQQGILNITNMEVDFPPLSIGGQNGNKNGEIGGINQTSEIHRTEDALSGAHNWHNSLSQQNQTWSQLMSTGKNRYVLQKKIISKSNDKFFITRDVIERGSLDWKNVIVGFFFDASFGFRYVERFLRNKWRLKGSLEINADKNFFYLTFSSDDDRKQVLDGGPFFINGKVFVLREWNHNIEVEKMSCKSLPIWARFWDIPKFLWNSEGLSTIASCIGNPLFADSNTMEKRRLGYARLCIEVDSSFEFPDKLHFESELLEFSIDVEYQWIPIKCRNCSCFGHHFHQCKIPTRREEEVQPASLNEQNGSEQDEDNLNKTKEAPVVMNSMSEDAHTSVPVVNLQDSETEKLNSPELLSEKVTVEVDKIVDGNNSEVLTEMNNEKNSKEQEEPLKENVSMEDYVSSNKNKGDMNKTSVEKQLQEKGSNDDKSEKRNNNVGSRKLQGRHEVVHIQKERDNRARTRSGAVLHTKNSYSSLTQNDEFARQFYEDYDEDGASEPDEDGIPIVDGVPKVLKSYPVNNTKGSKANNQNKKAVVTPNKEKGSKEIGPQNNRARSKFR